MNTNSSGCPICRSAARSVWVDERLVFLFDCSACSTFTITPERIVTFTAAWRDGDREVLMRLELLSSYLRNSDEDDERDIDDSTWESLAIEGQQVDEE